MTETIIIDGVDVSYCKFYDDTSLVTCPPNFDLCEHNPKCYYKQQQHKVEKLQIATEALQKLKNYITNFCANCSNSNDDDCLVFGECILDEITTPQLKIINETLERINND